MAFLDIKNVAISPAVWGSDFYGEVYVLRLIKTPFLN